MKKLLILLGMLLTLLFSAAQAEETVTFGSLTVDKNATYIDLGDQVVKDWNAFDAFLGKLPKLEKVDMFSTIVEKQDINQLVAKFPEIKFGWTIHITAKHYIRTDQTAFSTLHGNCSKHNSRTFEVLKYCTELRALDLGHNDITDISFLKDLTKLRVLILACNPDLRDLRPLSNLKELEYLELFSCDVRDLSALMELPNLMDLNLSYNRNFCVNRVLVQMPQLDRLWISYTSLLYNDTAVKQLREALPNTTIVTTGQPTDNGWRECEHYDKIYEIFHTDRYIPFEDSAPLEEPAQP